MSTLAHELNARVRPGELYEPLEGNRIRCFACGHCCPIPAGFAGVCKVRFNRGGKLYVPWGYVGALNVDPIEKKPFFHALPGARAFSFGMLGCDLHCGYCQNWITSQSLRDFRSTLQFQAAEPAQMARLAAAQGAACVVSTYNEPLITSEWAVAVFREARELGLRTAFVSNGNATPQVLDYLRPWVDLYKVDLKSFDEGRYRELGGRIGPILDSIGRIHALGFWLEVVTLIVPGFNDSDTELTAIARFLAGVSRDIPWHVTAFHPDYKMLKPGATPVETLVRAAAIGRAEGLHYVYAGNLAGEVGNLENTYCRACRTLLVRRIGFRVRENRITSAGTCPDCGAEIPGVWAVPPAFKVDDDLIHIRCG